MFDGASPEIPLVIPGVQPHELRFSDGSTLAWG